MNTSTSLTIVAFLLVIGVVFSGYTYFVTRENLNHTKNLNQIYSNEFGFLAFPTSDNKIEFIEIAKGKIKSVKEIGTNLIEDPQTNPDVLDEQRAGYKVILTKNQQTEEIFIPLPRVGLQSPIAIVKKCISCISFRDYFTLSIEEQLSIDDENFGVRALPELKNEASKKLTIFKTLTPGIFAENTELFLNDANEDILYLITQNEQQD